jgi:prepilin-type N-terminal cleavage/methylation domain-containing protein
MNNHSNNHLSGRGFTMIEIIIVLVIMVVLLSVVLNNFRLGERTQEFRSAVQYLASVIRTAQNSSMVGLADADSYGNSYGVYFSSLSASKTVYIFFEDINGDNKYNFPTDRIVDKINLPPEVNIEKIYIGPIATNETSSLSLVFAPPRPSIYVNGTTSISSNINIVLCRQFSSSTRGLVTFSSITGQLTSELQNNLCPN